MTFDDEEDSSKDQDDEEDSGEDQDDGVPPECFRPLTKTTAANDVAPKCSWPLTTKRAAARTTTTTTTSPPKCP